MAIVKVTEGNIRTLYEVVDYVLDENKLMFSHTFGMNPKRPFTDMMLTKQLWNKNYAQEYKQFIVSLSFDDSLSIDPEIFQKVGILIGHYYGTAWQVLVAGHCDEPQMHYHYIVHSVSPLTGCKFSIGPCDLYYFKLYVDSILLNHGFEPVRMWHSPGN